MTGRTVHVKMIDGRTFDIPEIWLAGFQQGARARKEPATIEDAIYFWAWQCELEALEDASA
jgi:hypothetical protein